MPQILRLRDLQEECRSERYDPYSSLSPRPLVWLGTTGLFISFIKDYVVDGEEK